MTPRIGSLFSGAGGLDLAVEAVFGGSTVWHCENNPAASQVLTARWPGVPNLGDITKVDWPAAPPVDILCGGFPCQDISAAGRQAGMGAGTRSGLWSQMRDAITSIRPQVVVVENVRNLLNVAANRAMEPAADTVGNSSSEPVLRGLGAILGDLSDIGYDAQWATVAAAALGAPHKRQRVFILSHPSSQPLRQQPITKPRRSGTAVAGQYHPTTTYPAGDRWHQGRPESARFVGGTDAALGRREPVALLPTPQCRDGKGASNLDGRVRDGRLRTIGDDSLPDAVARRQWGKYEPSIRRWEQLTRPAPSPTEPNSKGKPRLTAVFDEWMMGWPAGWVTDVDGISRNDALRIIGNGVVSQQAYAAIRYLLTIEAVAS